MRGRKERDSWVWESVVWWVRRARWRRMWAVRWAAMLEYIVDYWICKGFWKGNGRDGEVEKTLGLVHCAAKVSCAEPFSCKPPGAV
jgi:hypothetical protein